MLRFTRAAVCVVLAVFATAASAQNYPSGPVKLIVPIPAGGVTDVMARVIGQRLQEICVPTPGPLYPGDDGPDLRP